MLGSTNSPGETSRNLERQFTKAARICGEDKERVAIIFIDECDALFSSDIVAGMVASLLDRATGDGQDGWQRILVLAATNRIDSIPSFLRRPGRFDKEIPLSPPTAEERRVILKQLLLSLPNSQILDSKVISDLAEFSVGYVPADLSALVRKATYIAIEEGHASVIKPENLQRAAAEVGASALRESSMSAPPKMTWDDIAGDPGGAKVRFALHFLSFTTLLFAEI